MDMKISVIGPIIGQAVDEIGIAVVRENHRVVPCEESVELLVWGCVALDCRVIRSMGF
jgi:hypothetical protein